MLKTLRVAMTGVVLLACAGQLLGAHRFASHVVVPQSRVFSSRARSSVWVTHVRAGVVILEQVATTTLDIHLQNTSHRQEEAELIVPVPRGAVVRGFDFQGKGEEPSAKLLPRDEAKATYNAIVAKVRDPALLEFAGSNLIRSSVFPVPAEGKQAVRLTYEQVLMREGTRIDYELPRSESLTYTVPWEISVRVKSKQELATVYSPTHSLETKRVSPEIISARLKGDRTQEPGPFRLSCLVREGDVSASLIAYPEPGQDGGYFLLLASVPEEEPGSDPARESSHREVTLVIDRSGSMRGAKLKQAKEAARQIIEGLGIGEAFNIISYNDGISSFARAPVIKDDKGEMTAAAVRYLNGLSPRGGTNIHDALTEAITQPPTPKMLPIVLFLTDGLPTVGQTAETAIRDVAAKHNPHKRRIFTFGVGLDVNTPLLEALALDSRATATFVLPKEDVEAKVGMVFKRLSGPVLAEPELQETATAGTPSHRIRDLLPAALPDIFAGDRLVLLGRYSGTAPLTLTLSGNQADKKRVFRFRFDLKGASPQNAFVARLWASRRIAVLVDAIRRMGADGPPLAVNAAVFSSAALPPRALVSAARPTTPRFNELTEEIVRLSTEFGILTEYTAFLAREGTDLTQRDEILAEAQRNFQHRAMSTRSGIGSVNQSFNNDFQRQQDVLNRRNRFFDQNLTRVEIADVQQIRGRAFYRRGARWIDSRALQHSPPPARARVIAFGSPEFSELLETLVARGRQGEVALRGEVLLEIDGSLVVVRNPIVQK